MYCSYCGEKVSDGAKFCCKCGNRLENGSEQNEVLSSNNNERQEILQQLDAAIPIYQIIGEKEIEIQRLRQDRDKKRKGAASDYVIAVVIGGLIGVGLMIAIVLIFNPWFSRITDLVCIGYIASIVSALVLTEKKQRKKVSTINELLEVKERELCSYIDNNSIPELFYLPEKYRYYNAARYIRECIENERAHNLTDALNLYEEQLHRWKMENYQYNMYILNLQQMALLRLRR